MEKDTAKYYKRGNQYWKEKPDGNILMINLKEEGHHYDGDSHIFLKNSQFNTNGGIAITTSEFNKIRKEHLRRLLNF